MIKTKTNIKINITNIMSKMNNDNKLKEIHIKNCAYYFFDDLINIKNLDPNEIKIDEKSYKNILSYYVGHVISNGVKPLHLIINKVNEYI